MTYTINAHGRRFRVVNTPPAEVLQEFLAFTNHRATETVERVGSGACGTVWGIFGDYVIKENGTGFMGGGCEDGTILEALQGLPLVPTLYAYSTDNDYCLIQRIKGTTVSEFRTMPERDQIKQFDKSEWFKKSELFYEQSQQRGWLPRDLHNENVMVDVEGKLWVVDFGLFSHQSEGRTASRDRSVDMHIISIEAILTGGAPDYDSLPQNDSSSLSLDDGSMSVALSRSSFYEAYANKPVSSISTWSWSKDVEPMIATEQLLADFNISLNSAQLRFHKNGGEF